MPWARAVVNIGLGAALLDYWTLNPIEVHALAKAGRGERTDEEEKQEEVENQRKMAAALNLSMKRAR
jgi:hypothetical protein